MRKLFIVLFAAVVALSLSMPARAEGENERHEHKHHKHHKHHGHHQHPTSETETALEQR